MLLFALEFLCEEKTTLNQCNVVERNGRLVFALNSELFIPEDAPVRLTNAQLEELDYRKLYEAYSPGGRKSVTDPRVLFKVLVLGSSRIFAAQTITLTVISINEGNEKAHSCAVRQIGKGEPRSKPKAIAPDEPIFGGEGESLSPKMSCVTSF